MAISCEMLVFVFFDPHRVTNVRLASVKYFDILMNPAYIRPSCARGQPQVFSGKVVKLMSETRY